MICDESKASPRYEHSLIVRKINPHQIQLRCACQISCRPSFIIFFSYTAIHLNQFTLHCFSAYYYFVYYVANNIIKHGCKINAERKMEQRHPVTTDINMKVITNTTSLETNRPITDHKENIYRKKNTRTALFS